MELLEEYQKKSYLKNFLTSSSALSSNTNHICNTSNGYQPYTRNVVFYCTFNGSFIPTIIVNIPPTDQFGEMYTILFPSGGSKMVQSEIFEMAPATSRLTMDIKNPDPPPI